MPAIPAPESSPGSTSALGVANRTRVLGVLRGRPGDGPEADDGPPESYAQADLARATGLSRATVSNIVRDLVAAGLVESVPGRGRRGSSVRLSASAGTVAGVDFGHSHVAVALGDLTGRVLVEERRRVHADLEHGEALALAAEMLRGLQEQVPTAGALRHATVGLPAPLIDDVVRSSAIFPGWDDVDARAAAVAAFGVPATVENDANLGALAEHKLGVAAGHSSSVFVKISSGVGAGIVIDDRIFHGAWGSAGEIGHLTLDEQGPLCRCGSRGCLEAYASVGTIQAMMAGQLPDADLAAILDVARQGSVAARRALEDAGLHLGWALASIVNLLNPAIVVIGGNLAEAGDLLLEPARTGLRRHALDAVGQTPLAAGSLGSRASLVGAVLLAAERTDLAVGSEG
ncbi:MAG: transcriptional regulator [Nocardioides sp.]|nr:transcriptional regulator [Nocardioides sp.]